MTHAATLSPLYSTSHTLSIYSLFLFLSLSIWPSPHSFPFRIKDVSYIWEVSLNKRISKNAVLIFEGLHYNIITMAQDFQILLSLVYLSVFLYALI